MTSVSAHPGRLDGLLAQLGVARHGGLPTNDGATLPPLDYDVGPARGDLLQLVGLVEVQIRVGDVVHDAGVVEERVAVAVVMLNVQRNVRSALASPSLSTLIS
jgi:hypothetical protein